MNKKIVATLLVTGLVAGLTVGCGSSSDSSDSTTASDDSSEDLEVITVGAVPTPHEEILEQVKDKLAEEGYELKIVEYNDYVQPNVALDAGDLDANYFQHLPYLDNYNEENGTDLVGVAAVHYEPMGIYAGKTDSLEDLADGATVALPNDATNEARALLLLEQEGLITLNEDAGVEATVLDIVDNPLNLQFSELEAAQVAKSVQDVDIAVVNANYAIEEGIIDTQLAVEAADSLAAETYANYIVVRAGDEDTAKTKALVDAVLSDDVRDFINDTYNGAVLPVF